MSEVIHGTGRRTSPARHDFPALLPFDEHNQALQENVHPPDWVNPTPQGRYNLVIIGAGTAGLVTAAGAAGLGAKVALIERDLMGGDCLNVGCVPSKGLIAAARVARTVKYAEEFGVKIPEGMHVDFPQVMERMRGLRASLSPHDSAKRFQSLGVDVFLGPGRFVSSDTIEVEGQKLRFKKAVIATGARASAPPIPAFDQVNYLTNETVFSLTELPKRLGILGAGPIGAELAQAFANLGSEVFLIETEHGILPREDREAAAVVEASLKRDGVKLLCCGRDLKLDPIGERIRLSVDSHGTKYEEVVDQLLVAVGRAPNVEHMGLETVGVDFDPKTGIHVSDKLQTTNPRIYAAGDCCSKYKFTHAADFMARIVIANALFLGRSKLSALAIPWCTYTTPELAHVGLTEAEAQQQGVAIDTFMQSFAEVDRAVLDGETLGFVKVHVKKGTGKILGATILGPHAGDLIGEISLAMTNGLGLKKIAATLHPYPTLADGIRKLGDQYNRTRLTPFVKALLQKWLAWRR